MSDDPTPATPVDGGSVAPEATPVPAEQAAAPQPPGAPTERTFTYNTTVRLRISPMRLAVGFLAGGFALLVLLSLLLYFVRL